MSSLLKIVLLLSPILGIGFWAHKKVGSSCEMALALSRNVHRVTGWIEAADRDPFLSVQLSRSAIRRSLHQFQAAAAIVRGDYGLLRLDAESKIQLSAIAEARTEKKLSEALLKLRPEFLSGRCENPPGAREQAFAAQIDAGELDWAVAQTEAARDRKAFASDKEIYCQLDSLRAELALVVKAARERCVARLSKPGAAPCAPAMNAALMKEMQDLEEKREFNFSKLQRKWPAIVMEELICAPSA